MKTFIASFLIACSFGMIALPAASSAASSVSTACSALGSSSCSDKSGGISVSSIVKAVIDILSWVVGVTAVIMVILGGFNYITSGGDSNKVSSAKNTILYAVVGLVIVALAQSLVKYVLFHTVKK